MNALLTAGNLILAVILALGLIGLVALWCALRISGDCSRDEERREWERK